jgi:hypothetical protein
MSEIKEQILLRDGHRDPWTTIDEWKSSLGIDVIHQRLTNLEMELKTLKYMICDDSLESKIEDLEEQLQYKRNLLELRNKND